MDVSICNLPVTGGTVPKSPRIRSSMCTSAEILQGGVVSSELSQYWKARSHLVVCHDGLEVRLWFPNLFNGNPLTESTMATRVCNDADSEQRYLCGGPVKEHSQRLLGLCQTFCS